jgi:hypothetical protein
MPKDAKLGLVLGVCIVVALSVIYFRGDPPYGTAEDSPAAAVRSQESGARSQTRGGESEARRGESQQDPSESESDD